MTMAPPQILDISPQLHSGTAVFPGDEPFQNMVAMSFEKGDHLRLSAIRTTLHVGAHADAPSHYHPSGVGMSERDLRLYLGPAQIVDVRGLKPGARVLVSDVKNPITCRRVLFRTDSFTNPDQWRDDFNSLSPELIDWLTAQGVRLVGIDTPSVDPADSKALESHQSLFRNDLAVLEGLTLTQVQAGVYTLIALPLPLKGADASMVRAVLINGPQVFPEWL